VSKLADCDGEAAETQGWLDSARHCGYLSAVRHKELAGASAELGRMPGGMIEKQEKLAPA